MKTTPSIIHSTVGRRILGLFMACALLPICGLASFTLWQMTAKLQDGTHQRLKLTSKNVAMTMLEGLTFIQTEMGDMAENIRTTTRPDELSFNSLHQSLRITGLSRLRPDGTMATLYGPPSPPCQLTAPQQEHLASGKAWLFSATSGAAPPRLFMAIAADRERPERGALIGEIRTTYLWELVDCALPPQTDVTILGPGGVLFHSSHPPSKELVERTLDGVRRSSSGRFEFDGGAETQLASYWSFLLKGQYLSDNWIVVVSTPKEGAFGTVQRFIGMFVLILLLTLLVAYFLSSVHIRRILVPLMKLKDGTQNVGQGEFFSRVEIASGDEFEDVGRSFNFMADRLAGQFKTLEDTGNIVRTILIAPDEQSIVTAVLANLHAVVVCHIVGLSILDPAEAGTAWTYLSKRPSGTTEVLGRYRTFFLHEELLRLQSNPELIYVELDNCFTSLLSPIKDQGASSFNLLPIIIQDRVAGVLVLGNLLPSAQGHESLVRARTIADQVAVALAKSRLVEEREQLNWGALHALARTVDTKSKWTAGHSERVALLSQDIGRVMGLPNKELDLLYRASLLHDIGKIGVSEKLLDKPGKLTDTEFALICEHPAKGALILEPIKAFTEIIPLVAEHHERFNGQGYPCGLAGESISLGARILAVADVFDALISDRPYRDGWELHKVLAYIDEQAGGMFDPGVVKALLRLHPLYVRQGAVTSLVQAPGEAAAG